MDPQLVCKKSLAPPYQQSFRIDDLLTRKGMEQQPDHFSHHHTHHHYHAPLQPPPPGLGVACMEKTFPAEQKHSGLDNAMICPTPPMSGVGQGSESNHEAESKTLTKRSYSSTSNEDEDEMYRKRKKARTAFSREQVADLEKKFQDKKYLSSAERGELAERLKLSDMQVKTWFQNRRMKFKRQSEEAEMEMKSPKFPYSPFMPYGGVSSFYSYVPVPYKPHDSGSIPYTYGGSAAVALRSPQTTSPLNAGGMEGSNLVMNSPTMLGSLSSPLSTGMSSRLPSISTPISRPNGTSSYFNGLLTPISPSTGYQHGYFGNDGTIGSGSLNSHTQVHGFSDWPRAVPAPNTP